MAKKLGWPRLKEPVFRFGSFRRAAQTGRYSRVATALIGNFLSPYIILIGCLFTTAILAAWTYQSARLDDQMRFEELTRTGVSEIETRMAIYENYLSQVRGLFTIEPNLSRAKFKRFVANAQTQTNFPGVVAVAWAPRVAADKASTVIKHVRAQGFPSFHIWPTRRSEDGSEIYPSVYLEPFDAWNRRAFGFNMFSESNRREAMEKARDTGSPRITSQIVLVQERTLSPQPGFIIYQPVYENVGARLLTAAERRKKLIGFVYLALRADPLFHQIAPSLVKDGSIDIEMYDGSPAEIGADRLFFDSHPAGWAATDFKRLKQAGSTSLFGNLRSSSTFQVAGRAWTVTFTALPGFFTRTSHLLSSWILVVGCILSFLFFRLSRALSRYNAKVGSSEKQLRLVIDTIPALVSYIDRENVLQFANGAHEDWFDISPEAAKGRHIDELLADRLSPWSPDLHAPVWKGQSIKYEATALHPRLGPRSISVECAPDIREGGVIAGCIVLASDVTEQKRWAARLREDNRSLELINNFGLSFRSEIEVASLARRITGGAGEILQSQISYFQAGAERCVVGPLAELFTGEGDPRFSAYVRLAEEKFRASGGELSMRLDAGSLRAPELGDDFHFLSDALAAPLLSRAGEILGWLFFGHSEPHRFKDLDLSVLAGLAAQASVALDNARLVDELKKSDSASRKIAEENKRLYNEAQNLNRLKDEFLATVSHELRTPLNIIQGHAELLSSGLADDPPGDCNSELRESVEAIHRNAHAQTQLVSDLLDVSSFVTGKIKIFRENLVIADVVSAAVESLRFSATAKQLTVDVHFDGERDGITDWVEGDATRLQQVFWNLLTNAIKFTPMGGRVSIDAGPTTDTYVVRVRDSGQGIDPEFLPYVFDRFRQEDHSLSRRHGGLGLGLSIVKNLVELHGGGITVSSLGRGQGTEFVVSLPLKLSVAETSAAALKTDSETCNVDLRGKRILLLDDADDARKLVKLYLQRAGAEVIDAASASEGFQKLGDFEPDLIVSDIGMPDEDGYSFMRRVRSFEAERGRKRCPSIALTAYARNEDRLMAMEAGYSSHLTKPISSTGLIIEVGRAFITADEVQRNPSEQTGEQTGEQTLGH